MSASTSFRGGAVQPRISPGESGLDWGMVASYFVVQNFGLVGRVSKASRGVEGVVPSIRPAGPGIPGSRKSDVKSSFSRDKAATN